MTAQQSKHGVLKVGLVRAGKLIEEIHLAPKTSLHVGVEPENTFVVTGPEVPPRHALVEHAHDRYDLHILPGMTGKVVMGADPIDLADLAKAPGVVKKGAGWSIKLPVGAKGKVNFGDGAILFHILSASQVAPVVKLPKELRGGLVRSVDTHYLVMLLLSLLIHFLTVSYVSTLEPGEPPVPVIAETVEQYEVKLDESQLMVEPKPDESAPDEGKGEGKGKGGQKGDSKKPGPSGPETKGILALITKKANSGAVADLLSQEGIGEDINDSLTKLGGVEIARSGNLGTRDIVGGGGSGEKVGIEGLGRLSSGMKDVDLGNKGIRKVASVRGDDYQSQGKLDRNLIAQTVRGYLGAIKACYEMQLKRDPNLAGKITVQFTIGTDGRVVSATIVASTLQDELVKQCILRRIQRWKFPQPEEGTVTVSYPFIFTAVTGG